MSELLAAPGGPVSASTVSASTVSASTVSASTVSVAETAPARWGALPDPVAPPGGQEGSSPRASTLVRVSFWLSALGRVLDAVAGAGADAGVRPAVSGPAGAGALYACLDQGTPDADALRFVTALRERAADALGSAGPRGGVAVLAASPAVLTAGADGAVPGQALMRAVKDQFDPDHRMFPGRFRGGD
jgi:glycolate oxidase FAD binding subunit